MGNNLLVVTPAPAVAEAIRRSLEEVGNYAIHIVNNKAAAVVKTDEASCTLAILDLDLGENWVREIGQALKTIRPDIKLVVLCQDQTPPALDSIRPWILLRKPFHISELLQSLNKQPEEAGEPQMETITWLEDVAKAAQHLTRLTLESSAQAALITRKNDLWAYAGGLSQSAGKEVAQSVARNWDGQKGSDLLRFIRLESTRAEHMLYATRLGPDAVLALVFDAETPFSTIRMQANELVSEMTTEKTGPIPAQPVEDELEAEEPEGEFEEGELEIPAITDILTNIPSPDPTMSMRATSEHPDVNLPAGPMPDNGETRVSPMLSNAGVFHRESSPSVPLNQLLMAGQSQGTEGIDLTAPAKSKKRPTTPVRTPKEDELAETRVSPTTDAERRITLEPISAGLYHLTYACLLVPRFSAHYLTGDLADKLADWLPTVCVAFGWRLAYLAIRPEYLQWVVNVQPNTSPGYLMRVMRQQSSDKIFHEIPRLKKENPSGDFWAPGYLIMGGTQPHPPQLVRDYIKQARERQGVLRPKK
jgi:REP element-mobilizing transposase RayT/ActR/RegA family two-component response regulator